MAGSRKKASNGVKVIQSRTSSDFYLCLCGWRSRESHLGGVQPALLLTFCARSAIRTLGNALSILGLALAAASRLCRRYSVLILVSGSAFACIRVVGSSRLTVAADRLTARILDTICLA